MTAVLGRTNNLGMTRRQERRISKELRRQTRKALAERDLDNPLAQGIERKVPRR